MEVVIKCDQSEEATVYAAISKLCPDLKDIISKDIEIQSINVKFLKNNEEILLYMDPDISNMTIRKISAIGNVFRILWHIMNDSIADLIDKLGEFDVLINGEFLEGYDENKEILEEPISLFKNNDTIPTITFSGI